MMNSRTNIVERNPKRDPSDNANNRNEWNIGATAAQNIQEGGMKAAAASGISTQQPKYGMDDALEHARAETAQANPEFGSHINDEAGAGLGSAETRWTLPPGTVLESPDPY